MPSLTRRLFLLALGSLAPGLLVAASAAAASIGIGVLQPSPKHAVDFKQAGVSLVVVGVSWEHFEPAPDAPDPAYIGKLQRDIAAYRAAGLQVVLDLGFQYPPAWIFKLPDSRYRNQYGDTYADRASGKNIPDSIFNAAVRAHEAVYLQNLFHALGTDFFAVRLGGGWYGELNYPATVYNKHGNCYWAYDALAQGQRPGLPDGMTPCPVPGWKPGEPSPGHDSARRFLDWYIGCLQNYHDWQIATARRFFPGTLMMLYPSWGIRPGQIEPAVAGDLSGRTAPEHNGEIPRAFDFARFIAGIKDPGVWVHCTWIDASPEWCDETSPRPDRWSPIHFIADCAARHSPPINVSAENTGGGGPEILRLCAERAREYHLKTFFWAFAPDLFDGKPPELKDLVPAFAP